MYMLASSPILISVIQKKKKRELENLEASIVVWTCDCYLNDIEIVQTVSGRQVCLYLLHYVGKPT